jgi:hypothetical protein
MKLRDEWVASWEPRGVKTYAGAAAVALAIMLLSLEQHEGLGWERVIPVLVGVVGLVVRWSSAPLLVVLTLAWLLELPYVFFLGRPTPASSMRSLSPADLILCSSVFAYVIAHYRLQALTRHILPTTWRRNSGWCRSPDLVINEELLLMLALIPGWVVMAALLWSSRPAFDDHLGLPPSLWQVLLLVWFFGLGGLAATGLAYYARWTRVTPEEALLLLQDELWHETRREQRRPARWLAWLRLRRRKR